MLGAGKVVKPIPACWADNRKEYELIFMKNEVAEIFQPIPYIENIARQITTCTFSQSEAERCGCDGQANVKIRRIAICETIITKQDQNYWKMVYLHELAHILTNSEHTVIFHKLLDAMINLYNEETGESLKNDYQGME